ncbi:MAG: histidine--tRNA ligase [Candidatus Amoebophilus sp. 36-38]|nr:MAG: histidine--tRNA ligase [Candidatus Amoebophilus sp. 36-38]
MTEKRIPQLVKGTRDFDPVQVAQRNYISNIIQQVYRKYGFVPLETPSLEYLSTLLDQYGQEGEQLVFRVLNSGNFLEGITPDEFPQDYKRLLPKIAEKGLRYDLTVPLMRYIAMHHHELTFPFKRYQIQPVWRADRPQKGRFREFYQCDADIVGTSSLLNEAEILVMAYEVLQKLRITDFKIYLNHRSILNGIAELMGELNRVNEFCISIDKLDKIGKDSVIQELIEKGFAKTALEKFAFIFDFQGDNNLKLEILSEHLAGSKVGLQGLQDIQHILRYIKEMGMNTIPISLDPSLARGLAYYTSTVFEIKLPSIQIGSIAGGGRYDQLAKNFGVDGLTGVGLSFGVDRLHAAIENLDLFPKQVHSSTQVLFTNLDDEAEKIALGLLTKIRSHGISAELYPEQSKLKKQLNYANKKMMPFVIIIGEEERSVGKLMLKEMETGSQTLYTLDELINFLLGLEKNV